MNKISFYWSRIRKQEKRLLGLSTAQANLLETMRGKRIALVGNARSLSEKNYGAEIDAHDLIVRINRAPMPHRGSHGTRTDWLGVAVRMKAQDKVRFENARKLWMSHKRKRLDYETAISDGFYLHPLDDFGRLKAILGAPPTTGIMLIDLLARSEAKEIDLYGFDFFGSKSLSGRREAKNVPHDFDAERQFVESFVDCDPRISLMP